MKLKLSMEKIIEVEASMTSKTKRPKDSNAPKRPGSAYWIFQCERRPAMVEADPSLSGTPSKVVAKLLGTEWKALSSREKKAYHERYEKARKKYEKLFAQYQKSEEYKQHRVNMYAWRIHETRKPFRKDENAPKRNLSAYVLYANSIREKVKKCGRASFLALPQALKEISVMWKDLSPKEREKWDKKAQRDRARYQKELEAYQKTDDFKTYAQERREYKEKMLTARNRLLKKNKRKAAEKKAKTPTKKKQTPKKSSSGKKKKRSKTPSRGRKRSSSRKRSTSRRRRSSSRSKRKGRGGTRKAKKGSARRGVQRRTKAKRRSAKARKKGGSSDEESDVPMAGNSGKESDE